MAEPSKPQALKDGPLLLTPDNFTPLSRTPWAGDAIGRNYKDRVTPNAVGERIGESWEFSCDGKFPSKLKGDGKTLQALVEEAPEEVLGTRVSDRGTCEILVKLLNAQVPLSLQVHPRDDDSALASDECGKPESWLVLNAEPGAGIYMGFSQPVSRDMLREKLQQGDAAQDLLHFHEVRPGDYFEIAPGVPHSIGPGVTLLEPQRILKGKSGKTYRMWDWGRRYGPDGRPDPHSGKPRDLHVEESLRLVDPENQVGEDFVATLHRTGEELQVGRGINVTSYPANPYYQTHFVRMEAGRRLRVGFDDSYAAVIPVRGVFEAVTGQLPKGQPALLPAAAMPAEFAALEDSALAFVVPAGSRARFDDSSK